MISFDGGLSTKKKLDCKMRCDHHFSRTDQLVTIFKQMVVALSLFDVTSSLSFLFGRAPISWSSGACSAQVIRCSGLPDA